MPRVDSVPGVPLSLYSASAARPARRRRRRYPAAYKPKNLTMEAKLGLLTIRDGIILVRALAIPFFRPSPPQPHPKAILQWPLYGALSLRSRRPDSIQSSASFSRGRRTRESINGREKHCPGVRDIVYVVSCLRLWRNVRRQ